MKNSRKRQKPAIIQKGIIFPIVTLVVVSVALTISSFYEPTWLFNWKDIRQEIKDTIKSVDQYGQIPGYREGYAGETPKQWHQWQWLLNNTTEEELWLLMEYPSGTIKALAYEGLLRNSNTNQFDLISKALADTNTFVWIGRGCVSDPFLIGEYLQSVNSSLDLYQPSEMEFDNNTLTKEEAANLRALLKMRLAKKEKYLKDYSQLLHKRGW